MKQMKKLLAALLMMMTMVFAMAIISNAATITANKNYTKAPSIKKGKSYTVYSAAGGTQYFVKFKAPATGTYKFTISAMKNKKGEDFLGNFYICEPNSFGPVSTTVKTEGGKTACMFMSTKGWWNRYYASDPKSTSQYRYTRNAYIRLKKGQIVYVRSWNTGAKVKNSYALKVVKK